MMKPPSKPLQDDELRKRRRHLPHWQVGGSTYFITFRSARGPLSAEALVIARSLILEGHGIDYDVPFGVLMPDHVHMILRPREREPGVWCELSSIMKKIKGASARRINQAMSAHGTVWQSESFDRIIRDEAEFGEKWCYIYENPLRAGLVRDPEDYEFFIDPRGGESPRRESGT